jgi:hypothetical protein
MDMNVAFGNDSESFVFGLAFHPVNFNPAHICSI